MLIEPIFSFRNFLQCYKQQLLLSLSWQRQGQPLIDDQKCWSKNFRNIPGDIHDVVQFLKSCCLSTYNIRRAALLGVFQNFSKQFFLSKTLDGSFCQGQILERRSYLSVPITHYQCTWLKWTDDCKLPYWLHYL